MGSKQLTYIKLALEKLCCPYIEDGNVQYLAELLLHPGETRVKILHWLVTLYDSVFSGLLDDNSPVILNRIDSRHQKLLLVMNIMGVCKTNDLDLVRGSASQKKQIHFWKILINMTYISIFGCPFQPPQKEWINETIFCITARRPNITETFNNACKFVDTLIREIKVSKIFCSELNLLSLDISADINSANITLPTADMLIEISTVIQKDLQQIVRLLQGMQRNPEYEGFDQNTVENYCLKFNLTLTMFSQMIDSFILCYDNCMDAWCHKSKPQFSTLGLNITSVNYNMKFWDNLWNSIKQLHERSVFLIHDLKMKLQRLKRLDQNKKCGLGFQDVAVILQDTLQRTKLDKTISNQSFQ